MNVSDAPSAASSRERPPSLADDYDGDDFSQSTGDDWSDEGGQSTSTHDKLPANKDVKMINIIRSFVILLMLTIAAITANSVFVFYFIREENIYEEHLKDYSQRLIDHFYQELERKLTTAQTLSTTFTAHAYSTGARWPYVSFPDFAAQCAVPRQVGQVAAVSYTPLVPEYQRSRWETYASVFAYVATNNDGLDDHHDDEDPLQEDVPTKFYIHHNRSIDDGIYRVIHDRPVTDPGNNTKDGLYFPMWQTTPLSSSNATEIMFHHRSNPIREQALMGMMNSTAGSCSNVLLHSSGRTDYAFYSTPRSILYYPLWESLLKMNIVGALGLEFRWETFMTGVLDKEVEDPLMVFLESNCGGNYTFEVTGPQALYVGEGEWFDDTVEAKEIQSSNYSQFHLRLQQPNTSNTNSSNTCDFRITVYPTSDFRNSFLTNAPLYLKLLVGGVFVFTISVFIVYDCIVDGYQKRMVESAEKTHAIVRALFPQNVRDRLLKFNATKGHGGSVANTSNNHHHSVNGKDNWTIESNGSRLHHSPKFRLMNVLQSTAAGTSSSVADASAGDAGSTAGNFNDEPLADLYPEVTIMFSDIAGFTAWSSEREPSQVFTLLETIYGAMDKVAKKLGVFKVETIGDCYVAAAGLPNARKDHAEIMLRFARICMLKSRDLLVALEATLGPGTAELGMRTGLHSGPVTAGILRGEKSRFQLFGDTMNTTSRIESTGEKNKIQLSQDVYDYIEKAGKAHWVIPREGKVLAKGKGELQTYWLKLGNDSAASDSMDGSRKDEGKAIRRNTSLLGNKVLDPILWKTEANGTDERLIDWNCDVLMSLLANVVAGRADEKAAEQAIEKVEARPKDIPLREIVSVIKMPEYVDPTERRVNLPELVRAEMRNYVHAIASAYDRHSFHCFEHASHVALSASKLLKRIDCADSEDGMTLEELYEHTYGITSDPLTKFAVVFAALVHDVGHTGVSNGRLATECPDVAERYENKCLAEQRSVEAAWELLMLPQYENLRSCMFGNKQSESQRFRQLLVNCVLATDIFDPTLSDLRKDRWVKAFKSASNGLGTGPLLLTPEELSRRATVVIEHIIQASDVSHTMQHWHIYKKWNGRLFEEMFAAYKAGRLEKDPSENWYKGELWFFDNYVIPLTLKLKECGVFGASGDEYHTYAVRNRQEWARRGEEECLLMVERAREKFAEKDAHLFL